MQLKIEENIVINPQKTTDRPLMSNLNIARIVSTFTSFLVISGSLRGRIAVTQSVSVRCIRWALTRNIDVKGSKNSHKPPRNKIPWVLRSAILKVCICWTLAGGNRIYQ